MKKLFICVMTSLCSTFAFADADLVVKPATISNGNGTMQVVINKAGQTAFQFDVKLPAGVSATAFTLTGAPESRKFEKAEYEKSSNTWRFLTYDEGNAELAEGATFDVTLAAADGATTGEAETSEILLVNPQGNSTEVDGGNVAVNVENGVSITIGQYGKGTLVSSKDLDFSSVEGLKAYIVTGYIKDDNKIMMTRVKDVPANTPIIVIGDPDTYLVPETTSSSYYPENFLKGNATAAYTVDNSGKYLNMKMKQGEFIGMSDESFTAGKCYLQLPANITSNYGTGLTFKMGQYGKKSYVGNYDLDFTGLDAEGLKAYILIGCNSAGTIFMMRVSKASAQTPLLLIGNANTNYTVPSTSSLQSSYINMLQGDANSAVAINRINGSYANWTLKQGEFVPYGSASGEIPAGSCYLPIPTSIVSVPALSRNMGVAQTEFDEAEVLMMSLGNIGVNNDGTTSIRSIGEVQSDDAWYNLKGQRIDTPTKKGLYIKNGKKVVVK